MKHTLKRLVILGILASSISLLFANVLENKNAIGVYVIGAENEECQSQCYAQS